MYWSRLFPKLRDSNTDCRSEKMVEFENLYTDGNTGCYQFKSLTIYTLIKSLTQNKSV